MLTITTVSYASTSLQVKLLLLPSHSLFMLTRPYSKGCWSPVLVGFLWCTVLKKHNFCPLKLVNPLMAHLHTVHKSYPTTTYKQATYRFHLIIGCKHQLIGKCFTIILVPEHKKLVSNTIDLMTFKGYCQGCAQQFHKQNQEMSASPISSIFIIWIKGLETI